MTPTTDTQVAMMRTVTRRKSNGELRFCYGLFTAALMISAFVGLLIGLQFDHLSDQMRLWLAAAVGGNLGPLVIDAIRRGVLH